MNDDELRSRLARLDPQATAPVEPITSPRAQDLLERVMSTSVPTSTDTTSAVDSRRPSRRGFALLASAAAVALGVTGAIVLSQDGSPAGPGPAAKKTSLALSLPGGGLSLNSCLPFSVDNLKMFPIAFAGTVSSVAGDTVSLDVTTWYVGGTAQVVTLQSPDNTTSAALDGVTFAAGKDYLVTASDGAVSTCGYSGAASPTLEKAFADAFGQ